jgi:hypothetical protein
MRGCRPIGGESASLGLNELAVLDGRMGLSAKDGRD